MTIYMTGKKSWKDKLLARLGIRRRPCEIPKGFRDTVSGYYYFPPESMLKSVIRAIKERFRRDQSGK